ncbi:hypothetical protein L798_10655 [Zootermopsis nevadensis]|uniref:Uncharacterized protein n=1 Tax=Zootermopsis nevadensis TaxID=136037 RepID=A0A067QX76_ZOONE|nr:hypothetical protein L798_10655 [Zootermopsis nevadensis]
MTSQQLILAQVHALDDVTAVIEHTPDVLCVHRTCEVRIAIMLPIPTCCADTLELITNEVFGSDHFRVLARLSCRIYWCLIS